MSRSILVAGYYGFGNTGDEAILSGMLHDLRELETGLRAVVVSGDPSATSAMHGVPSVLWTDLSEIARSIREADLVVLGGGGLFHDYWGCDSRTILTASHSGISYFAGIPLMARLLQKPTMLYAIGIGPLYSEAARQMTAIALQTAQQTTFRDMHSLRMATELRNWTSAESSLWEVTADPAFSLEPAHDDAVASTLRQAGVETDRPLLGVCLRRWDVGIDQERWEVEVASGLDQFLGRQGHHALFIPFQAGASPDLEDVRVAERVIRSMDHSKRASLLTRTLAPSIAYGLLGHCSVVLGMRLHAVLFALNAGVPTVALAYDEKVNSLMARAAGKDCSLEVPNWRSERISEALNRAIGSAVAAGRENFRRQARHLARRNAELALGLRVPEPKSEESVEEFIRGLAPSRSLDLFIHNRSVNALATDKAALEDALSDARAEAHSLREQVGLKDAEMAKLVGELGEANERKARSETHLRELLDIHAGLEAQMNTEREARARLASELHLVQTSRYWRALSIYWNARQWPRRWASTLADGARRAARRLGLARVRRWLRSRREALALSQATSASSVAWEGPSPAPGKVDILVLPIIAWDFRFQRPQHLSRQFARNGHRVFYLSASFHAGSDITIRTLESHVFEVGLPGPMGKSIYADTLSEHDAKILEDGLGRLAAVAGMNEAVCLLQLPFWRPLASRARMRFGWRIVYDCMDDHSGFDTNSSQMLAEETRLLQECDLALATSAALVRKCEALANSVVLIPNAVDYEAFSQAAAQAARPPEMIGIPGPIIGYVGAISEWFDFAGIRNAATVHPEWSFVLVGRDWGAEEHADLLRRSNVHFMGEQPYDRLPAFLAHFDICCIPFKTSSLTEATDPVKLYEYLAVGKPVVSTPIAEVARRGSLVRIAATPESFTAAIERELAGNVPGAIEKRKEFAANNTWAQRFASLGPAIDTLYGRVSVIVLAWNNLELTKACLASLDRTTCYPNLELILIDNASTDGTADHFSHLAESEDVHAIINRENRGFAAAINQGLREASGDFIILLNNDVVLTRGWLSKLVARLESDPSIGIIGPVSNGAGNEAHVEPGYVGLEGLENFAASLESRYRCELAPVRMLAMYCLVARRQVFLEVGPLDERFEVGMFEDDDYAIRVRAAGFAVSCARDVYVHHHGQSGFRLHGAEMYQQLLERNREEFETKWGVKWERHKYGGLDDVAALQSRLVQFTEGRQASRGVVVVPPPSQGGSALRAMHRSIAEDKAASGYLVFWCDGENRLGVAEEIADRLYRIPPTAEALDGFLGPLVPAECQNAAFRLRLRRPRSF